ncbi:Dienelactone hydrolase-like enzyme precursor [Sphingomonas paucimobilis]|nr:Dienelactone hydrolase-like enzyme precursor [Sphingomonas paucimobilis]
MTLARTWKARTGWMLAALATAQTGGAAAQAVRAKPTVASAAPASMAEPGAIPLYPPARGKQGKAAETEIWSVNPGEGRSVRNVTVPTLTPVLPEAGKANGAAVIVAPGGGFMMLSMDHEGYKVARQLADRGIAAFVLKYRLIPTPADQKEAMREMAARIGAAVRGGPGAAKLEKPEATADAIAALRMVRTDAAKWGVDPARIGMIGFSAGAMTALNVVLQAPAAERPAFFGYIYGPQTAVAVPADAPPMFNAIAMDDQLFPTMGFPIAEAWHKAKRPVEIHAYQKGYHGFGLGRPGTTTTLLMDEFHAWMAMQGFLGSQTKK